MTTRFAVECMKNEVDELTLTVGTTATLTADTLGESIAWMLVNQVVVPIALQDVGELQQVDGVYVFDFAVNRHER